MTDQQASSANYSHRNWVLFLIISVYLICSCFWRTLTIVNELPVRSEQLLTLGLDCLAIIGLIGLKVRLPRGKILFQIALIAGLGLLAIRLTGDAGWWSGHLFFKLCPRDASGEIVCRCRDQFVSWLCP